MKGAWMGGNTATRLRRDEMHQGASDDVPAVLIGKFVH